MSTADTLPAGTITAPHECDGRRCVEPAVVRRSVRLGCGCVRHECDRHDNTAGVHFLSGCHIHGADFEVA